MRLPAIKVFKGAAGWYWHMRSTNGEIQASSEGYTRRCDAVRGAEAFKRNATRAIVVIDAR